MEITVLFFASIKDAMRTNHMSLTLTDGATVADVRATLAQRFPDASNHLNHAIAAINQDFATDSDTLKADDEVAFFPPVSGGSTRTLPEVFLLADEPVDHNAIVQAVTTPATGAVALFSGMVRGETQKDGHLPRTLRLQYEAYEPMALAKMRQVALEIREQWPLVQGIAIVQRIGQINVGENTVLIACSAAHRDQGCFEAARYGIDRLKEIVPVWKKEIGANGQGWIEGDYHPTPADRAE